MSEETKTKKSKLHLFLLIASIFLAVILVAAVAVCIFLNTFSFTGSFGINTIDTATTPPTYSSEELDDILGPTETIQKDPIFEEADPIFVGKDVINILLVGQDKRSGQTQKRQRTDAMILCTINKATKTVTMTSFMRDLWVYVPGKYNQRLNVPYVLGGFPLLNETLSYNFGVSADYNVEIDFEGFIKSIDIIGGIDVELTKEEADYLNERGNWDIEENKGWTLKEGVNRLNGSQALAYTRIRKIDNDFERTNRQRKVLNTLIEKAKTLGVSDLYRLAKEIMPNLTTDMNDKQILGLIVDMLPILSDLTIVSQRIPTKGAYYYARTEKNQSVLMMKPEHVEKNKALLIEAMKAKVVGALS
ncbi:MAG: LCP family protein [Oscillospiraceae bacterium]|nr:LCP family protein [Oscillospiraceae bacterium]